MALLHTNGCCRRVLAHVFQKSPAVRDTQQGATCVQSARATCCRDTKLTAQRTNYRYRRFSHPATVSARFEALESYHHYSYPRAKFQTAVGEEQGGGKVLYSAKP